LSIYISFNLEISEHQFQYRSSRLQTVYIGNGRTRIVLKVPVGLYNTIIYENLFATEIAEAPDATLFLPLNSDLRTRCKIGRQDFTLKYPSSFQSLGLIPPTQEQHFCGPPLSILRSSSLCHGQNHIRDISLLSLHI
jgi:hypothetical protein